MTELYYNGDQSKDGGCLTLAFGQRPGLSFQACWEVARRFACRLIMEFLGETAFVRGSLHSSTGLQLGESMAGQAGKMKTRAV